MAWAFLSIIFLLSSIIFFFQNKKEKRFFYLMKFSQLQCKINVFVKNSLLNDFCLLQNLKFKINNLNSIFYFLFSSLYSPKILFLKTQFQEKKLDLYFLVVAPKVLHTLVFLKCLSKLV